ERKRLNCQAAMPSFCRIRTRWRPLSKKRPRPRSRCASYIWATSYILDFSIVKLPVFDADGFPVQKDGATGYQALPLPAFLADAKSGLLFEAGESTKNRRSH